MKDHSPPAISCIISPENPCIVIESSVSNSTQTLDSLDMTRTVGNWPDNSTMTKVSSEGSWPFPMTRVSYRCSRSNTLNSKTTTESTSAVINQRHSVLSRYSSGYLNDVKGNEGAVSLLNRRLVSPQNAVHDHGWIFKINISHNICCPRHYILGPFFSSNFHSIRLIIRYIICLQLFSITKQSLIETYTSRAFE